MRNVVLIVDDVEFNRELLTEILENDYEIMTAGTGREALQILEKDHDKIALMILDLVMPEMDGFQVLEEVKTKPWSGQLAVIIISSEDTVKIEKKCFDMGWLTSSAGLLRTSWSRGGFTMSFPCISIRRVWNRRWSSRQRR